MRGLLNCASNGGAQHVLGFADRIGCDRGYELAFSFIASQALRQLGWIADAALAHDQCGFSAPTSIAQRVATARCGVARTLLDNLSKRDAQDVEGLCGDLRGLPSSLSQDLKSSALIIDA